MSKIVLKSLSSDESIKIDKMVFYSSAVKNMRDLMQNETKRENQKLSVECFLCKKDEFKKLDDKNYEAKLIGIMNIEKNELIAIEITLPNVDISFNQKDVEYNGDNVCVNRAEIVVRPFGKCSFKVLED